MIPTPAAKLASDSITSPSGQVYRPLDIDTLYYTRSMFTLRWSVDGEHLYFETNFTGRYNIWRVPSQGG
ncbi:S9 family peptidase, partial [Candidatus Bathyarchaeota archaeon]